jgi:hypothetical protein
VSRLHSGDPSVFSAIAEQMRRLDTAGVPYDVTPGVPAFAAAAAERDAPGPVVTIGPVAPDPYRWRAGPVVANSYLVYDPVARITADDGSWTLLEADGRGMSDSDLLITVDRCAVRGPASLVRTLPRSGGRLR